jgi:predicted Zn-dependent peptidase
MKRADLVKFWECRYTPNNMAFSIAGKFDWDRFVEQLSALTLGWTPGVGRSSVPIPPVSVSTHVVRRETTQEHLGMAFPGVAIADPRYYAAALLAQVLGGGTTSRLHQEVREKRGLAYSAAARFDGLERTGLFRIYVGTSAERAHESVDVVAEELKKLEASGFTESELQLAKVRLKSQLIMRSESSRARMGANLRSWWFEGELHDLAEVRQRIDAVTVDQVHALAREVAPTHNLTVVAIGPQPAEEVLGPLAGPTASVSRT